MFRWSFYPVADNYLLVAGAGLVLLALLALGPGRERTTRQRRRILAALRFAVVLLVILAMLRPTLVYTKTEKQAATFLVLADRSLSMTVPDEAQGRSRWEALKQTLADAKRPLAALARDFEVKAYAFDAEAHPVDVDDGAIRLGESADGTETAIGSVLDDVLRNEAGKRLLGIVLLSDGAQRAYPPRDALPQTAAARLKPLGYPLFTVRFGKARGLGQARDVSVHDLLANPQVFVKNELTVAGQVRADGYADRTIPVQLLVETSPGKMEPVAQQDVQVLADGESIPVEFTYVPELPGEYKVSIEIPEQKGELVTTNNRLSTFVNVLKGGLNVLYLEGFPPRTEQKFLRRALDASPDIHVDTRHIDPRHPRETRPADLGERLKPGKYEVYLLGNLDLGTPEAPVFLPGELEDLAESVSRGAGLIMIGGLHSFGPGGYADTPLADVLPIRMDRFERQRLDEKLSPDLHLLREVPMMPTQRGLAHFALNLGGQGRGSQQVWSQLPPLQGANRLAVEGLKPAAIVLAEAAPDRPLLVAHEYGAGRVMAFAGDSTWRWAMRGHQAEHRRFWRQVILWLARKDERLEGNVQIEFDQRRLRPGQRVEFTTTAYSPEGAVVEDARFQAEIVLPDGTTRQAELSHSRTTAVGSFRDTVDPGDYSLRVTARKEGEVLGAAESRFLVFEQNLELDNAAADATMLENLAAMTGGRAVVPEELPGLIEQLTEETESLEVRTETKKSLWDTWGFFTLLVGLLAGEWFLRKRWGLV